MGSKKIIIIGAGEGGKRLAGEINRGQKDLKITGFLDDNPNLRQKSVLDIPVLGQIKELAKVSAKFEIEEVMIAIPSLRGQKLATIVDLIQKNNLPFRILPGIFESIDYLVKKQVPTGKLRDIALEDLLSRDPISIDLDKVSSYLRGQIILITGAGGSIGSELARQIIQFQPQKVILLDIYENNLYELSQELQNSLVEIIVGDLKDQKNLKEIFNKFRPQIIFHAAAHKHVPLMEKEPREAIKNNILGTANLINLSLDYQVQKFIFISTDKAINPSSIMGATKRFSEEQIRSTKNKETVFAIVRFGNVLGSYGSVIPLWKKQLANGQALTVTHPKMQRFFMTIPEAVQLVIQAGAMATKNETFILKMGRQYKIVDLAHEFIRLQGLIPNQDVRTIFTSPRPGEKLSETLHEEGEILINSSHKMIVQIKPKRKPDPLKIKQTLNKFYREIDVLNPQQIIALLQGLIPSFVSHQKLNLPLKTDRLIEFAPPSISSQEVKAVTQVLTSHWLTMGTKVSEFEKDFAQFCRIEYAVAVNSATAGLHLALLTLGIGKDDEVILPSYTFASCANTIVWTGARPVFADITQDGLLIDPTDIEKKITKKTKAIMVVHYGGQTAEMEPILHLAKKHNLKIIEDCAHSLGATYQGQLAGAMGDIGVFSFYATKNMTTGEGGMVVTRNTKIAERLKILRLHGLSADAYNRYSARGQWRYEIQEAGFKYNLTDIAAAIGIEQLKKLPSFNRERGEIAERYLQNLQGFELILPKVLPGRQSVWHLFPVLVEPTKRDALIEFLKKYNISTSVHFIPLHLQPFYREKFGTKIGDLPVTEEVFLREISLPIYPGLRNKEVEYIAKVINYFLTYGLI